MMIHVNGVDLFYHKTGSGPPLVLLHGNGEDHTVFNALAPRLARHFTLYALDSRGHGHSSPVNTLSYADMTADVAAFISAMGLNKPVVLGFSDGGITGLMLAFTHPKLPGRLVVCGANTWPGQLKGWFLAMARLGYLFTRDPKLKMMFTQPDITPEQLERIAVPTLVLAGSRDILPERDTRAIAAAIPHSRVAILPGEGHASYVTRHSHRLYQVLAPFLGL